MRRHWPRNESLDLSVCGITLASHDVPTLHVERVNCRACQERLSFSLLDLMRAGWIWPHPTSVTR